MFFRQLQTTGSSLSCLFGCGSPGKAIAVDVVAGDEDWFIERAAEIGVEVTHVIDTHVHADHYSGGRALARRTGGVYCLHESNQGVVEFPFHPLKDGDRLAAGNVEVEVVHTPGHTGDSICLLVSDKRRGDQPWFVLTGDTLFSGGIGRPDLAGREREMAGQLFDSLHERLLVLADETEIYPGHYAGSACGAGLSAKPSSTIGFEKRFSPGLRIAEREGFVDFLTAEIPPRPEGMDACVAANTAA